MRPPHDRSWDFTLFSGPGYEQIYNAAPQNARRFGPPDVRIWDFAVVELGFRFRKFGYSTKSRQSGFQILEFMDLEPEIRLMIWSVVFHPPDVNIRHRQMPPFRAAGCQHIWEFDRWSIKNLASGDLAFGLLPELGFGEFGT